LRLCLIGKKDLVYLTPKNREREREREREIEGERKTMTPKKGRFFDLRVPTLTRLMMKLTLKSFGRDHLKNPLEEIIRLWQYI
jgi:hypothetical protein